MALTRNSFVLVLLALGMGGGFVGHFSVGAAEAPKGRILYDTKADGTEQIKAALEQAAKENKNVILKFGANWCGWCHRLSDTFKTNPEIAKTLKENYLLVLIDVDKGHNAEVVKIRRADEARSASAGGARQDRETVVDAGYRQAGGG